jgi:VanZ family protein
LTLEHRLATTTVGSMTPRRRSPATALVLAGYVACLAIALGLVTVLPSAATLLKTIAGLAVGAARSVGLLTFSDGFVQALAVSGLIVPVLPLVRSAVLPRWRTRASGLASATVALACVVVSLWANEGGAGALAGRFASLLLAASVGLALGLLVARAAAVVGTPTPAGTPARKVRAGAVAAAVVYVVVLALIAFTSRPVDQGLGPRLERVLTAVHRLGVPGWVDYATVEFSANIALFVPLGLFVVLLVGIERWWWGPVAGLLASGVIELGQLLFLPGRFASADDVLANMSGAVVGALVGVVVLDVLHRRTVSGE